MGRGPGGSGGPGFGQTAPTSAPAARRKTALVHARRSGRANAAPGGRPDLNTAARRLGISVQTLRRALGPPPPNLRTSAARLGISVAEPPVGAGGAVGRAEPRRLLPPSPA